jgi:hypothetical protein
MSHEDDQSVEIEQRLLELRIGEISKAAKVDYTQNPGCHCKWCGEYTGINRRFCDNERECADAWEKHQ